MRSPRFLVARNGRRAAAVLATVLALPALASAATIVIQPSNQDAFIRKNFPNRVTGTKNARLRVEASMLNTTVRRSLVQFPLGSIPAGAVVTSAVIELYADINARSTSLTHGPGP